MKELNAVQLEEVNGGSLSKAAAAYRAGIEAGQAFVQWLRN